MAPARLRLPIAQGLKAATEIFKRRTDTSASPIDKDRLFRAAPAPHEHVARMDVSVNRDRSEL